MYVEFMVGVLMTKLKDVFSLQITGEWGIEYTENETNTKVLRTTNFTLDGIINYSDVVLRCIHKDKVEKKKLRYGDIILEKSGGTEKTPVGRVVFCDESIEKDTYLCNNFTQAMRVNREIAVPKYVFYFMWNLHNSGKTELLQNKTTGIRNLQVKSYLNEEIPLPPLDEQRKIAAVLDKVSDLIAKRRQQLTKLDELVKARFVEMFGEEQRRVLVQDVCRIITDGTHQPPAFIQKGVPFIFVSNLIGDQVTYDTEKFISEETYAALVERTPLEIGDVLLTTVGSYGHAAVVRSEKRFLFQRHIAYLKPKADQVDSTYLQGFFLSPDGQKQIECGVKGIAQKTLNLSEIKKMLIPLPDMEKQMRYSNFVVQAEKSKMDVEKSLFQLKILKNVLMQKYFGGGMQ